MSNNANQILQEIYTSNIAWKLLDIYFNQSNILVKHQLESFNRFVDTYIPNILAKISQTLQELVLKHLVQIKIIGNVSVSVILLIFHVLDLHKL